MDSKKTKKDFADSSLDNNKNKDIKDSSDIIEKNLDLVKKKNKSNKFKSARTLSRELTLQALYAWWQSGSDPQRIAGDMLESKKDQLHQIDQSFFLGLFLGVVSDHKFLNEMLEPWIDRDINQLDTVEHMILFIGIYELTKRIDVPTKVVLNESIELSKLFAGKDSYKYINATLDSISKVARKSINVEKTDMHHRRPKTTKATVTLKRKPNLKNNS